MAVTQPPTASAAPGVAAQAPARADAPGRQGTVLLAALVAACLYAAFASGATGYPDETWLQAGLAAVALGATAAWAGQRGIGARASLPAVYGIALLVAFAAWCGLSLLWSVTPDRSWLELDRALAYVLVAGLGIAAGTSAPRALERVALGWLGVSAAVALYALGGKVLPGLHVGGLIDLDHTARVARLRAPLGDPNALGLVCALGIPVALWLAADALRPTRARLAGLAIAFLELTVLAMTYSRGSVLALAVAVVVLVAVSGAGLRLLTALALTALTAAPGIVVALTRDGLTRDGASLGTRISDGRGLLAVQVGCLAVLLAVGWLWTRVQDPQDVQPAASRRRAWAVLGGVAVAGIVAALIALAASSGGIGGQVSDGWDRLTAAEQGPGTDAGRLTSTESGNRWVWWGEALGAWSDKPAGGWGAGSFPATHLRYRSDTVPADRPQSVPLQWLAETGVIGLLLGLGGLALLAWAAVARVRALPPGRERDVAAALLAAAAAWFAHAATASDWDVPGVTVPALLFLGVLAGGVARRSPVAGVPGAVVLVDPERPSRVTPGRTAVMLVATLLACAYAASAVLPSWSDGLSSSAQERSERPRPTAASLQAAAADADIAASLDPVAVRPLLVGATIANQRGRSLEARRLLLEAVRRQPDSAESWAALARTATALADRAGAERAALRALELDPQSPALRRLAQEAETNLAPPGGSATATGTPLTAPSP
jgi:hypothetical protein